MIDNNKNDDITPMTAIGCGCCVASLLVSGALLYAVWFLLPAINKILEHNFLK